MAGQVDAQPQQDPPSIFRRQALAHHRKGRWTEVLPPATGSAAVRPLWAVLGVLGLLFLGLTTIPIPTYAAASAIVVSGGTVGLQPESAALILVLPMSSLPGLVLGMPAVVEQGRIYGAVARSYPQGISRTELSVRFEIPIAVTNGLPDPAAVAVIRLDSGSDTVEVGSRYQASVRVGSHRILADVPLLGRLVG